MSWGAARLPTPRARLASAPASDLLSHLRGRLRETQLGGDEGWPVSLPPNRKTSTADINAIH
eukprot:1472839-Pyramimonas_sp.AAC.3